jgi:hypothetical protein
MEAARCARPGAPRRRQRAALVATARRTLPPAVTAALLLPLALAGAAAALPRAGARPLGGGGGGPGPGRALLDFRVGLGAATFTDPSAALDDPFSVGLPSPSAASPVPAPEGARRMAARPKDTPPPRGGASRVQLPRCYFSPEMKRCFLNPYYPLAYEPPAKDPAAR